MLERASGFPDRLLFSPLSQVKAFALSSRILVPSSLHASATPGPDILSSILLTKRGDFST